MKCNVCGEQVEIPFKCTYCKESFCLKHRLPESHHCPEAPTSTSLGSLQAKKEMDILRAEKKPLTASSAGLGKARFVGRDLPTFHFNKNSKKKTQLRFPNRKERGKKSG
jgi:hypothetical protein